MARIAHPLAFMTDDTPAEEMQAFFHAPLDREYFESWIGYLAAVFDYTPSETRTAAMYEALGQAKFLNRELGIAGDWIVGHNERFPVPAHFINCPGLSRNTMPSAGRDEG